MTTPYRNAPVNAPRLRTLEPEEEMRLLLAVPRGRLWQWFFHLAMGCVILSASAYLARADIRSAMLSVYGFAYLLPFFAWARQRWAVARLRTQGYAIPDELTHTPWRRVVVDARVHEHPLDEAGAGGHRLRTAG